MDTILDTLAALLPGCAASYEQVLRDISQGARVSWRGTAAELREVLREVMDRLAPDDKVMAATGFPARSESAWTDTTAESQVHFAGKAKSKHRGYRG